MLAITEERRAGIGEGKEGRAVPKAPPATLPTIIRPIALPRKRGPKMSAMMVCPATMKYVPVKPVPNSLIAVKVAILGATAVPIDVINMTASAEM